MFRYFFNLFKPKNKPAAAIIDQPGSHIPDAQAEISVTSNARADVSVAYVKRLVPIAQLLGEQEIAELFISSVDYPPGAVIFTRNSEVEALLYVLKGSVYLEAANGAGQEVSADTLKAFYPLSFGAVHTLTAIAKTAATLIYVPKEVLQRKPSNQLSIPSSAKDNLFLQHFYEHFQRGNLDIPSFPDVALKMRRAIQQDLDVAEVAKIINLDPALSGKLIQVVNSPLYRSHVAINNCLNAVNRLGLTTTRNLVTALSLKNLVSSEQPHIKKRILEAWQQGIRVSSISYVLAKLTKQADPEEALLAGLLHNIGCLPIIMFADKLPASDYQSADIDLCITELQGQVGNYILDKWNFSDESKHIPLQSGNWFNSSGNKLSMNDIVTLAKYHYLLALPGKPVLPIISTLPAFQKLTNQPLTPEMSLQVLQEAKQQISETMSLFAP
ncbi:MAG: HDOD domain-containing protein [Methylococcales bacterium]